MRPARVIEGFLFVACVVPAALFGFACAFDYDGTAAWRRARWTSPPSLPTTPARRWSRTLTGLPLDLAPRPGSVSLPQGLLAAVPGGLCLLI